MTCDTCGYVNREGAHFCGGCGAALVTKMPCRSCGAANPVGQVFCNSCGATLAEARPPAASGPADGQASPAERKQVTVLFCDVEGSMSLTGALDPEIWRSIMGRFFELFREEIERLEGTVDKFTGDGAMAIFGAPVAQEDHAARACHAALSIRERIERYAVGLERDHGISFEVRTGLNSGEVVAGSIAASGSGGYTAIGTTVGLASRMESIAQPGRACMTEATAGLVRGLFELEDQGELEVRGLDVPIRVYELVAELASGSRQRSLSVALVARRDELAILEGALERALDGGQAIGIVGDPGMGKSRLCGEFAERCRDRGIRFTHGRGIAHSKGVPLLPVLGILRQWFGLSDDDDPARVRALLEAGLDAGWEETDDAITVLQDFLGTSSDEAPTGRQINPAERQRLLFAAIRQIVIDPDREGPGVLLVEDLHWLDPGSDAFLAHLVESLPGSRTLLVVNFRPEYRADWMAKPFYRQISLPALGGEEVDLLFERLAGSDASLDGLAGLIQSRTGGNPLFVEEVVQAMSDSGTLAGEPGGYRLTRPVEEIKIPATVQAVLAARIDRLPAREKELLGGAAVIGHTFSREVLEAISDSDASGFDDSLSVLQSADLIFEASSVPSAEYEFEHGLIQEVAYSSQLRERRVELHRSVADAIESLHADRIDELAALVGYHREQAGQLAAAAASFARAATWAGQHHPADAMRHWGRVRSLLTTVDRTVETDALALQGCLWTLQFGWRLGLSDEQLEEIATEGLMLAESNGDKVAKVAMLGAVGLARGMSGDVEAALRLSYEGDALAQETDVRTELRPAAPTWYWNAAQGNLELALAEIDEALADCQGRYEIGRDIIGLSLPIFLTYFRGQILCDIGRAKDAEEWLRLAIELAEAHDDVESLGWAHSSLAALDWYGGELGDEAVEHGRRGVAIGERLGSPFSTVTSQWLLALAHITCGQWREAITAAQRSREGMAQTGTGTQYGGMASMVLAEALLGSGDAEGAVATAREAVATAVRRRSAVSEARARAALGRALLAAGELAEAEDELGLVIAMGAGIERATTPRAHEALADLAAARDQPAERRRHLELARDGYATGGAVSHLRRVEFALEDLRTAAS